MSINKNISVNWKLLLGFTFLQISVTLVIKRIYGIDLMQIGPFLLGWVSSFITAEAIKVK